MVEFLEILEEKCGQIHNDTTVSISSAVVASSLMLLTIPSNVLLIFVLVKERKTKYKTLFYKLLLNIAFADLLTGVVADPSAVSMLTKETLRRRIVKYEVIVFHVSLFYTDAVALLTLTLLSIDRIVAILCPIKHFKGVKKNTENVLVSSAWTGALILVLPYFKLNFIRQSLIFSTVNVAVAVLSLFITLVTYIRKLRPSQAAVYRKKQCGGGSRVIANRKVCATRSVDSNGGCNDVNRVVEGGAGTKSSTTHAITPSVRIAKNKRNFEQHNIKKQQNSKKTTFIGIEQPSLATQVGPQTGFGASATAAPNKSNKAGGAKNNTLNKRRSHLRQLHNQHRATRTFVTMICVFLATYLPSVGTMIYMNFCTSCDCSVIHILRDVSSLCVLSSSMFRPLNFILTLRHVRKSVVAILIKRKQHEQFTISGRSEISDK